jgi:hypothetical protein
MADAGGGEPAPKTEIPPAGTIAVNLQLSPDTLKLIADLSAKLKTDPAQVLGEALTFFSAVKEAHDDGGQVIIPSGVIRTRFKQEIDLE